MGQLIYLKNTHFDFNKTDEMDKRLLATAKQVTNDIAEQLEQVEKFKQDIEDIHRNIRISMEHEITKDIFVKYQRLGGKSDDDEFMKHLKYFYELTLNVYVYGSCLYLDGTFCNGRREAWEKWVLYIGSFDEADLYMQAVDNITTYS